MKHNVVGKGSKFPIPFVLSSQRASSSQKVPEAYFPQRRVLPIKFEQVLGGTL